MTYIQTNIMDLIAEGERLKQEGLERAVDHAERVVPEWKEIAWDFFQKWLTRIPSGLKFKMEDFRTWAECHDMPSPPSKRAIGFIPLKAVKEGLIKKCGLTSVTLNPKAHGCFCSQWQKL